MEQPWNEGTGKELDVSEANPGPVRGIAICAGLGGLFLVAYAILMAMKPPGTVGGSYRESGALESILFLAGVGLIIATAVGLYWMHRLDLRGSKVVRIASITAAISLLMGLGLAGSAFFWLGLAALVVAVLAFAVAGAGLMRSALLPAWSGALLIVASLLLLLTNTENEQILFVIPFGLTWMVLSGLLWLAAPSPSSRAA